MQFCIVIALLLMLSGCSQFKGMDSAKSKRPYPDTAQATASSIRLHGSLRGPVAAFGPKLEFDVWLCRDGSLRAEISRESQDARPSIEILLWSQDSAILFEKATGRFTELALEKGSIETAHGLFSLQDALWIFWGFIPSGLDDAIQWQEQGSQLRGISPDRGYRRHMENGKVLWSEILWKDDDGAIHDLKSKVLRWGDSSWGNLPLAMAIDGSDLEGIAKIEWQIVSEQACGDSLFDPLWEHK